ncbi:MAG: hypothetical protein IJ300_04690 [Clostridia bacterium]|nr:hypothetical protein [Clostridia bacterium]
MENKNNVPDLYFYTAMPEIHLEYKKYNELYERAFLSREDKNDCEYCLNTTCWD